MIINKTVFINSNQGDVVYGVRIDFQIFILCSNNLFVAKMIDRGLHSKFLANQDCVYKIVNWQENFGWGPQSMKRNHVSREKLFRGWLKLKWFKTSTVKFELTLQVPKLFDVLD